jgi:hypothetical protein
LGDSNRRDKATYPWVLPGLKKSWQLNNSASPTSSFPNLTRLKA